MDFGFLMEISCTCGGVSRRFLFDVKGLRFSFTDALSRCDAKLASRNDARSAFIPMTGVSLCNSRTLYMEGLRPEIKPLVLQTR